MTSVAERDGVAVRLLALADMEREHDLFAYRVDGWSAWRILRNPIYQQTVALPASTVTRSDVTRSLRAIAGAFKLFWLLVSGPRRELLVKTCRSALRVRVGNRFRDVYFDGLIASGHSCLKLEEINTPDFEKQAAAALRPSDLDPVVFTFWGRVFGLLFPVDASKFCASISALADQKLQVSVAPSWLRMRLSTVYWQSRFYGALLKRIRPSAVLVSETGDYALVIACHRVGIPIIELQHGVFDTNHPDAVPAWVNGSAFELVLPHVLACRGDFWMSRLEGTRQGRDHAIVVGNEQVDETRDRRRARVSSGSNRNIIVTSQGLDSDRLATWLSSMIAAAPPTLDWRMTIKLHPVYDVRTKDFDSLRSDRRVRVIHGSEEPHLFDLLVDADLHVSIASASHFDAAAVGVPSIVVPLAGHEIMEEAIDGEQMYLAEQPSDVWRYVSLQQIEATRSHRFAAPGFIGNLEQIINSVRESLPGTRA